MTKKMIHVTERDIGEGQRGSCLSCPVALALKRAFPTYNVMVGACSLLVDDGLRTTIARKDFFEDVRIQKFIDLFDTDQDVQPFSFEVEVIGC